MGHVSERKDREVLLDERRRLLDYVLETHKAHGGKVQLPIGMNTAEPWLLDAVDVQALLAGLHHHPQSCVDLLQYCRKATRTISSKLSRCLSDADSPDLEAEREAPLLHLPQLNIGLSESEIKDLAYLVFASNCNQGTDEELLSTVRSQLDIDEARAGEVARLLAVVTSTFAKMKDATGTLPVSDTWTANLELPVCLLGVVLPKDFNRFRSFVVWRDTLSHVLLSTLAASVRDGWSQQQGSNSPSAQQLMARLKAALRRCDVRDADDFDEEEYRIASRAVGEHAYAIVKYTTAGWAFPWGLRVRLCEMLLRGVFDSLDETSYIDDADNYLRLLQTRLWPLLKISPSMHNAGFAWIHFRQFVVTQHPSLVSKTKALLKRLAQLARRQSRSGSGGGGGSGPNSNCDASVESAEDAVLTQEVGTAVIDWIAERLADYHVRLSAVGGPDGLPNLVDVMAFAALSRGASQQEVGDMMAAAIRSSVSKELQRRVTAAGVAEDEAEACETMCDIMQQLAREEVGTWASGFAGQLPEAVPLALAVLHEAAGARILPWLSSIQTLDDSTCKVLRAAMELEPMLLSPVAAAADVCQHAATRQTLASARSWDIPAQLQPALAAWVQKQLSGFTTWVDRQLQQESWTPLGLAQPHSASARELRRIALESLEALFDLQLPLPASIVSMLMEGIDSMLHQYLQGVLKLLGSWTDMIPAVPGLTRYKREVAVKQEQAEIDMPGMPTELPPLGCESKKGVPFVEAVRRIEQESCYERITRLTPEVLIVMMASLGYLLDTLQPIATAVADKWQEECRRSSPGSSRLAGDHNGSSRGGAGGAFLGSSTAAAAAAADRNPFLSPSPDLRGGSGGGVGRCSSDAAATDSWGGSWGLQQQQQGCAAAAAAANGGGREYGSNSSSGGWGMSRQAVDLFGETLDCAGQSLRSGIVTVTKWLAVRVVWWQQRAGWCELLYRHRVTSCRIDWLLGGLADVLGGPVSMLPNKPRLDVASAILKEAALGLERALLDGGPCKWFIPADVAHLTDDLDSLEKLFYAEGDGLQMQEVSSTIAGLRSLLKVLSKPTGTLIEDHRAARRRALANFSPGIADVANGTAAAAVYGNGYGPPYAGSTGNSSKHLQQQALPLSGSKLAAAAASGGTTGSGGVYIPAAAIYSPQNTGGSGRYSPRGGGGNSPRNAPNAAAAAAAAATAGQSVMTIAAAGGDVGSQEHVLLKVMCHRADHAASKYLKESTKVPKPRDETVKETFSRLTRLGKK